MGPVTNYGDGPLPQFIMMTLVYTLHIVIHSRVVLTDLKFGYSFKLKSLNYAHQSLNFAQANTF